LVGEILAVGTELLLGQIVDTNSAYLSRRLAEIGVDVFFKSCVGDNVGRVASTLRLALSRSDLVIITGGLGPTDDDVTVYAVADVLSRKLVYSAKVQSDIVKYFRKTGRQTTNNNRKQAMVIEGSSIIRNEIGTAPGQIIEDSGKIVVLVPGVPREMTAMIEGTVIPYLKQRLRSAGSAVIRSRVLRTAGIGESALAAEIQDILSSQTNPTIAPLASDGLVDLRITVKAPDDESALHMIDTVAQRIRGRLGSLIYGEDEETLAQVIGGLLLATGDTIALAESCTGGLLGKLITDVPGSSRYFLGGTVTYSNESKTKLLGVQPEVLERHGAVSRQCAAAMALGAKRLFESSVSVSVTGLAGPGGGTASKPVGLVYAAVACNRLLSTVRLLLNGNRDQVRARACVAVLNLVRKVLAASSQGETVRGTGGSGDLRW
jgi:nicotinamide-nucleotide amidase